LVELIWTSPVTLASVRATGLPLEDQQALFCLVRDVILRYCKTARRQKSATPEKLSKRKAQNQLHTNRGRLARRLSMGHREAAIQCGLSDEQEQKGYKVLRASFMPEIRRVGEEYFEHRELTWWSPEFRAVYRRASKYMPAYPRQKAIRVSEESSEIFVKPPVGAPDWAVTLPDEDDLAAVDRAGEGDDDDNAMG
jgi:hypothetical protein